VPAVREFVRVVFWDWVLDLMHPTFETIFGTLFDYGFPIGLVIIGLWLLAQGQRDAVAAWVRRKLNIYLVIAAALGFASIVFVALFIWDRSRGPVLWTWNYNSPISFWKEADAPLKVASFNVVGENRSNDPLTGVSAFIRSDITGQKYPMKILSHGTPGDATTISPHSNFTLVLDLSAVNPAWNGNTFAETLRSSLPRFSFIFEYNGGAPYNVQFIQSDIDGYIEEATKINQNPLTLREMVIRR
jgi:hypothetical protein